MTALNKGRVPEELVVRADRGDLVPGHHSPGRQAGTGISQTHCT